MVSVPPAEMDSMFRLDVAIFIGAAPTIFVAGSVAFMSVDPRLTFVAKPVLFTVATPVFVELQVTEFVISV